VGISIIALGFDALRSAIDADESAQSSATYQVIALWPADALLSALWAFILY
jgi:hypothetical protein